MRYITVILVMLLFSSCINEKEIVLKINTSTSIIEKKVPVDLKEITYGSVKYKLIDISGLEKLKSLNKLLFGETMNYMDFSFLSRLKNLEVLILECQVKDFSFLKNLENIKVLYLNGINIQKNEINLINNKKIIFLALNAIVLAKDRENSI